MEIQVLAWDRHKNVAVLNLLVGYQPSPLIFGSPMTICFHSKRPHDL